MNNQTSMWGKIPMWTTEEALLFIREINGLFSDNNWLLSLGGSLCTRSGASDNDCDLVATPRGQTADLIPVCEALAQRGWSIVSTYKELPHRVIVSFEQMAGSKKLEVIFFFPDYGAMSKSTLGWVADQKVEKIEQPKKEGGKGKLVVEPLNESIWRAKKPFWTW